jgi:hypothetical protein
MGAAAGGDRPDSRFLAIRHAGQEATDFSLADAQVRRFVELRDAGAGEQAISSELGLEPEVVRQLVSADEAQALAHRIAIGEEPMYPPPRPEEQVQDTRLGSSTVPVLVLIAVLIGVIVYALAMR